MVKNIIVKKNSGEHTSQVLRRFTHAVRSSGIIPHMRKIRYRSRNASRFLVKRNALRRINRRNLFEKLIKEGKISDSARGKRIKWHQ